jgi:hypothetical protein
VAQFVLGRFFRSLRAPLLDGRVARRPFNLSGAKDSFAEVSHSESEHKGQNSKTSA